MGKTLRKLMIGVGLAGVVGYLTGILTAPKSGRETREDLKKAAKTGIGQGEKQLKAMVAELGDAINDARQAATQLSERSRQELDELVDKARIAREKAREVVSAVHEGDAEDNDLKTAVTQANSALNHLRAYLKK